MMVFTACTVVMGNTDQDLVSSSSCEQRFGFLGQTSLIVVFRSLQDKGCYCSLIIL